MICINIGSGALASCCRGVTGTSTLVAGVWQLVIATVMETTPVSRVSAFVISNTGDIVRKINADSSLISSKLTVWDYTVLAQDSVRRHSGVVKSLFAAAYRTMNQTKIT